MDNDTTSDNTTHLHTQVPVDHIRLTSSLIVALGKVPLVTPPSPLQQASLYLTLSHWALSVALTVQLSPGGILNEKKLDSILCSQFGYSKGPFATMREVCLFVTLH